MKTRSTQNDLRCRAIIERDTLRTRRFAQTSLPSREGWLSDHSAAWSARWSWTSSAWERFDPVFRIADYAGYVHESMPADILEGMNLKQYVLNAAGGPIQRFIASRWLRNMDNKAVARFIHAHRPKDVVAQWEKLENAQGLAFIAPVFWLHFPAILKGWFERAMPMG